MGAVGRAGRGQQACRQVDCIGPVGLVGLPGLLPGAKDVTDGGALDFSGNIVQLCMANAAVVSAVNIRLGKDIPEGNFMTLGKFTAGIGMQGLGFVKKPCQGRPKAVLRVTVIKTPPP